VVRLRTRAALNSRLSSHVLIQYVNAPGSWSTNFRLPYAFAEGTDYVLLEIGVRALRASPVMRRTARV
jgi:hypothetical protein